jgi:hypothetical protein
MVWHVQSGSHNVAENHEMTSPAIPFDIVTLHFDEGSGVW